MYVLLPNKSSTDKLKNFQNNITPEVIENLIENLRPTSTIMLLPKMHLSTSLNLRDDLLQLGVTSLFDPSLANLALMSPGENVRTSSRPSIPVTRPANLSPNRFSSGGSNNKVSSGFGVNLEDTLIFSRLSEVDDSTTAKISVGNCSELFNGAAAPNCTVELDAEDTTSDNELTKGRSRVIYKKIGNQIGRRFERDVKPNRDWLKDVVIYKKGFKTQDAVQDKKKLKSKSNMRVRRQTKSSLDSVRRELNRSSNPGLFASDVIHKVDLTVTESGTEGAAASVVTITRDGGHAVFRADTPFLFLIRNDPTKIPLFYGTVNLPT